VPSWYDSGFRTKYIIDLTFKILGTVRSINSNSNTILVPRKELRNVGDDLKKWKNGSWVA